MKFVVSLCLMMLYFYAPCEAQTYMTSNNVAMRVALEFSEGHFCAECDLGVRETIKDKSLRWVDPEYEVTERWPSGMVVVALREGSEFDPEKLAKLIKKNVLRASLQKMSVETTDGRRTEYKVTGDQVEKISF